MSVIEITYGSKDYDRVARRHIDDGDAIAIRVSAKRSKSVYKFLSAYCDYEEKLSRGINSRKLLLVLALRSFGAVSLFGICNHARLVGMGMTTAQQDGDLIVNISPSLPTH